MSTSATSKGAAAGAADHPMDASPGNKGKGKASDAMEVEGEEEEEESDEEDDEEEESEGELGEEDVEALDPTVIVGRRTRGVKVDYTSPEALKKAGLTSNDHDDDGEGEESFHHDEEMKE